MHYTTTAYHKIRDAYNKIEMDDLARAECIDNMMERIKYMSIPEGRVKCRVALLTPVKSIKFNAAEGSADKAEMPAIVEFDIVTTPDGTRYLA